MKNWITIILFKIGLFRLRDGRVYYWTKAQNVQMLRYALQNGIYHIRIGAVEGLIKIDSVKAQIALRYAVDDKVEMVAVPAIEHLLDTSISLDYRKKLKSKLASWTKIIEERKSQPHKRRKPQAPKWDRPGKHRLAEVKRLLKKGMRGIG